MNISPFFGRASRCVGAPRQLLFLGIWLHVSRREFLFEFHPTSKKIDGFSLGRLLVSLCIGGEYGIFLDVSWAGLLDVSGSPDSDYYLMTPY